MQNEHTLPLHVSIMGLLFVYGMNYATCISMLFVVHRTDLTHGWNITHLFEFQTIVIELELHV